MIYSDIMSGSVFDARLSIRGGQSIQGDTWYQGWQSK